MRQSEEMDSGITDFVWPKYVCSKLEQMKSRLLPKNSSEWKALKHARCRSGASGSSHTATGGIWCLRNRGLPISTGMIAAIISHRRLSWRAWICELCSSFSVTRPCRWLFGTAISLNLMISQSRKTVQGKRRRWGGGKRTKGRCLR